MQAVTHTIKADAQLDMDDDGYSLTIMIENGYIKSEFYIANPLDVTARSWRRLITKQNGSITLIKADTLEMTIHKRADVYEFTVNVVVNGRWIYQNAYCESRYLNDHLTWCIDTLEGVRAWDN